MFLRALGTGAVRLLPRPLPCCPDRPSGAPATPDPPGCCSRRMSTAFRMLGTGTWSEGLEGRPRLWTAYWMPSVLETIIGIARGREGPAAASSCVGQRDMRDTRDMRDRGTRGT